MSLTHLQVQDPIISKVLVAKQKLDIAEQEYAEAVERLKATALLLPNTKIEVEEGKIARGVQRRLCEPGRTHLTKWLEASGRFDCLAYTIHNERLKALRVLEPDLDRVVSGL